MSKICVRGTHASTYYIGWMLILDTQLTRHICLTNSGCVWPIRQVRQSVDEQMLQCGTALSVVSPLQCGTGCRQWVHSGVAQFASSVGAERIAVSDAAVQTYTSGSKIKLHKRIKVIPVSWNGYYKSTWLGIFCASWRRFSLSFLCHQATWHNCRHALTVYSHIFYHHLSERHYAEEINAYKQIKINKKLSI